MAEPALESTPFQLPVRIRSRKSSADMLASRIALAERLSAFPDLTVLETSDPTVPWSVNVYLQLSGTVAIRERPAMQMCSFEPEGIRVHGLSDRDRYQVLARGWGRLTRSSVVLHPPRDAGEMDVCWEILQRAYRSLLQSSAHPSPARSAARIDYLPRFSRTTLQ
jgi:hypothetical protein